MMGRTLEGTIFEIVFLVLALALWGYVVWLIRQAPDVVPTHFDAAGRPNGWGSPTSVIFPSLMMTVVGACLLATAYFPKSINLPVAIENPRQILLAMRMVRILALLVLLLALAIALTILTAIASKWLFVCLVVGIMGAVCIGFSILIYRAG